MQEADGAFGWAAKAKVFKGTVRRGAAALRLRWAVISPGATGALAEVAKAAKSSRLPSDTRSSKATARGVKRRHVETGTAAAAAHQAAEAAVRIPSLRSCAWHKIEGTRHSCSSAQLSFELLVMMAGDGVGAERGKAARARARGTPPSPRTADSRRLTHCSSSVSRYIGNYNGWHGADQSVSFTAACFIGLRS